MRAILVDDEPIALELLNRKLSAFDSVNVIASFTDPLEALEKAKELKPEVIFLDIEMGEISGVDLVPYFAQELDTVEIVFTTAYYEYAVDAFEVNALDYLLKPIQENRLEKTVKRLEEHIGGKSRPEDRELRIRSFGRFEVTDYKGTPLIWRTQKSKELFAYLWHRGNRATERTWIMENIFPDRDLDRAKTLLHTTVYQLRKNLRNLGYPQGIIYFNESYRLDLPIASDYGELLGIIKGWDLCDEDMLKVLDIYLGDFMESEGYHWAKGVQQFCRDSVFNLLLNYVRRQLTSKDLDPPLKMCLDTLYSMDPFNDHVAEMMIGYYGASRKKGKLKTFFKRYIRDLWWEMGLKPSKETLHLYREYVQD